MTRFAELRHRLFFLLGALIVYRIGTFIPAPGIDPVAVRRRIGMVFQKPNPFPKSIYDNVAFGPRILGDTDDLDATVEEALRGAGRRGISG